jgi:hypothetical protein
MLQRAAVGTVPDAYIYHPSRDLSVPEGDHTGAFGSIHRGIKIVNHVTEDRQKAIDAQCRE